jgi:Pro-kumamolisin, activation domain
MARKRGRTPLAGSERARPKTHKLLGPVADEEAIGVTVVVRARPDSPPLPDLEDWQRTPPGERSFLSPEEYAQRHGAAAEDLAAVAAFAREHGLQVRESHVGRRSVSLEGTAAQMNSAFGVTLKRYEAPLPAGPSHTTTGSAGSTTEPTGATAPPSTHVHHGFDGPVRLQPELVGIVTAVVGLDDRRIASPAGGTGDPSGANLVTVPAVAGLYNFPTTGAADQTIGVVTMGGAYLASDITAYFNGISQTNYQTAPATVHDIDLTVGTTTYKNNTSLVQQITSANVGQAQFGGVLELTQDIDTSATIAQGATVNVYFTEASEQGWLVLLNRILQPEAEQQPTVVTCSWFVWLGDDSSYIGKLSDSGSTVSLMTALFQQLASLGINVFIAQGDWGADNWWTLSTKSPTVPDGKSHVQYAASDPWVTSCGGTVLALDSSPAGFQEWAWSDAWSTTSKFTFGANSGATGGGVSATFSAPPYQTAAGITGAVDSAGTNHAGRGVPDVAAMVGYSGSGSADWFLANGARYNFVGTSCVAPLMAGLAAVLRSAFGRALAPYNTLLYQLGDSAFNDITNGNNDSVDTPANVKSVIPSYTGHTPDAPYFTTGSGWDACTGLGSIDGTKLLNGIASLLYTPNFYFQVNKGSFGLDEVNVNASYSQPPPLWLVLEGYTPDAVTAAHLAPTVQVSVAGLTVSVGAAVFEIATQTSTPQRVLFPCSVDFAASATKTVAQGGIFPAPASPPTPTTVELISSVTIGGRILSAETNLELEPGADPYFANFDAAAANPFWLSQDLRVFTVTPGVNNAPVDGIALNASDNTHWDTSAAYQYIQSLLAHLNTTYYDSAQGDAFAAFPDQTNALSGDSSVTPTSINPADATGTRFANYNFAVARLRLSGAANSSSGANVRVLFRLFAAETSDTDYQPLTYPSTSDSEGQPLAPQLGSGNVTIPFFATGNYQSNSDHSANVDYSANSINNQPVSISASGDAFAYYGCYLNIYPTHNTINGKAVQTLLPSSHSCIVAQLVYDDAPMPTGPGVLQGPEYSDNFAQRNLQITFSDNPGPASAHKVPQTFDTRPSPAPGSGQLESYPDELMIDWGQTPIGSGASIYWPQVASADVLALANTLYSTHQLSADGPNTIQCKVPDGLTFVPIPAGTGENYAGLFTVDLPPGVAAGQEFTIAVRRVSTRRAIAPPPQSFGGEGGTASAEIVRDPHQEIMRNWRYIVGTFAVLIPVATADTILPLEEDTLAIMKWRLGQMTPPNRWIAVLKRYIDLIEQRVNGLGGQTGTITPSPWGAHGPPPHIEPPVVREATGKINGVAYDRFGDFEGFLLLTEAGHERGFVSREAEIESLVRFAWQDRVVVTVVTEAHEPERPVRIVLRHAPRQSWPV